MSLLVKNMSELPPKILSVIEDQHQAAIFCCALKTSYKPNASIPILWIVLTKTNFLLCNTHKSRGLTAHHTWSEINEIRKKQGTGKVVTLEIIFNDLSAKDIALPLPAAVTAADMAEIISLCAGLKKQAA